MKVKNSVSEDPERGPAKSTVTRPDDPAVKVAVLLSFPYVLWLSRFSDAYVEQIHGLPITMNFDGILLMLHNLMQNGNMIIHEAGHGICYLIGCPPFLTAMNGTNFQLLLPLFFIVYYYRRHNVLLMGVGGMWLAQNLIYVAWYMSTAHFPGKYPDFLGNDNAMHDFRYLFTRLGVLDYSELIAGMTRLVAVSLLFASWGFLVRLSFFPSQRRSRAGRSAPPRRKKRAN